ncbi:inorganic phosphate transporter [Acidaminobacter sp. JC074]|uniref:inorganic phosphate transporter n=1 Tax=Acidaminobacter sp. JC074 TaxID=2530199 RepID=UPI001F1031C8|nr:inorganic phosphate transporter [Acidaminobacter sp. JC074]MCH4889677.1 inorganic phosphate transporter [Acidaminobacter sp. JC074]
MDLTILFISSGLFLGWSLGANDAANIFGTAVGAKVIKFRSAAIIMSIFVIIGAVASGSGASHTLGKLGAVSTLPGAFIVALSAGLTVFIMTRYGLPVSTSQSIVGAIIGWNLFTSNPTSLSTLSKIVMTWFLCPILAALFSIIFYKLFKNRTKTLKLNLFLRHYFIRVGLIIVGAFGAYSLGANNIANVMGVFTNAVDINSVDLGLFTINKIQILFLIGALAIAVGIFTYSKNVMSTVGNSLYRLSPSTALIVVLSSSFVLFIFASVSLQEFLISLNLPPIPLVPVSSSQAVVGSIIGIGVAKGDRNINYSKLKMISFGWLLTPTISLILSYVSLFFMQNVFVQNVL